MIDTLGARITRLREQAGLSQTELAKRLHVSRSTVQSWESGHTCPCTDKIAALSRLLHTSTDYLLDCENEHTICLDMYNDHEQALVLRLLQYFDENPDPDHKPFDPAK